MNNPRRFARELQKSTGLHPIWLPGAPISIGTVVVNDGGIYKPIDHLSSRGIQFSTKLAKAIDLKFESKGVTTIATTAQGAVDASQFKGKAAATLTYQFKKDDSFVLNASHCTGAQLKSPLSVARAVKALTNTKWRYMSYFIVSRVYSAHRMVVLANRNREASVTFKGEAGTIKKILQGEVSAEVSYGRKGSMALEILGNEGGPVCMEVFRIRKRNGKIVID